MRALTILWIFNLLQLLTAAFLPLNNTVESLGEKTTAPKASAVPQVGNTTIFDPDTHIYCYNSFPHLHLTESSCYELFDALETIPNLNEQQLVKTENFQPLRYWDKDRCSLYLYTQTDQGVDKFSLADWLRKLRTILRYCAEEGNPGLGGYASVGERGLFRAFAERNFFQGEEASGNINIL
ncbi:uncharacterized protein KY384_006232 [Bacidia gigantensis]|uniref:uncharacterized protein n=1 Tax=Bacidia gigantensis TaxID=2732470 RepID=UPI001D03F231|nr:uncharacterized protein KY384_006232 [Bacidia gigantensis]KAG8529595.1 hypothetical protein KY384_006232 [Bacidia gigantensis]